MKKYLAQVIITQVGDDEGDWSDDVVADQNEEWMSFEFQTDDEKPVAFVTDKLSGIPGIGPFGD